MEKLLKNTHIYIICGKLYTGADKLILEVLSVESYRGPQDASAVRLKSQAAFKCY